MAPYKRYLTGIFDLPFELRRMIYFQSLPPDRIMHFPMADDRVEEGKILHLPLEHQSAEEKTMFDICAAHPSLYDEVWASIYEKCSVSTLKSSQQADR